MTGLKVIDGTPTEISKYLRERKDEMIIKIPEHKINNGLFDKVIPDKFKEVKRNKTNSYPNIEMKHSLNKNKAGEGK